MKVAITGGTGFVGSHLANRLISEGHELVLLARHSRSSEDLNFVSSNLSDVKQLTASFSGCHAVAHCAGINRELGKQTFQRVHVDATRNVVEAAKTAGVKDCANEFPASAPKLRLALPRIKVGSGGDRS